MDCPFQVAILSPQFVHLFLKILHLLDGRHPSVGFLRELALDIAAGALGAARSLGGVTFDLSLPAGITRGILPPLSISSFLSLNIGRQLCAGEAWCATSRLVGRHGFFASHRGRPSRVV